MPTSYQDVYFKSATIIDSYKFDKLLKENLIGFFKAMYPFLISAIGEFSTSIELYDYLQYRKEPVNEFQKFVADGINSNFNLDFAVDSSLENVFFDVYLNETKLDDSEYIYDEENKSINLTTVPTKDSIITVEYYYCGEIIGTNDESINIELTDKSTQLLAAMLTLKWLEKNKNRELNIRANLGVKEYNMFSPANLIKETRTLYQQAYDMIVSMQRSLSWEQKFIKAKSGKGHSLFVTVKSK